MGLLTACTLRDDLDRATPHHVERVPGFPLPADRLAAAVLELVQVRREPGELVLVEVAQEVDLTQRPDQLALPAIICDCSRHALQVEGSNRERNLDAVAPQRVPETRHDLVAHTILLGVVDHPEADAVLDCEIPVLDHPNLRGRAVCQLRIVMEHTQDDLLHASRRRVVGETDEQVVTDGVAPVVGDDVPRQHRVRHLETLERAGDQTCGAPADSLHAPEMGSEAHPVARGERLLQLERQPAEHIAEGLLQRQTDHRRDQR